MTNSKKTSSHEDPDQMPLWMQLSLGAGAILFIIIIASFTSLYSSAWGKEDSSYYGNAQLALRMYNLNPSGPTAFVFWERGCEECIKSIRALQSAPSALRVYGVHVSDQENEIKIRNEWLKVAPRASITYIDRSDLLKTSFQVRGVPTVVILFPRKKVAYTYVGDLTQVRTEMVEIIKENK